MTLVLDRNSGGDQRDVSTSCPPPVLCSGKKKRSRMKFDDAAAAKRDAPKMTTSAHEEDTHESGHESNETMPFAARDKRAQGAHAASKMCSQLLGEEDDKNDTTGEEEQLAQETLRYINGILPTSRFRGASWQKRRKKGQVTIKDVNGTRHHLVGTGFAGRAATRPEEVYSHQPHRPASSSRTAHKDATTAAAKSDIFADAGAGIRLRDFMSQEEEEGVARDDARPADTTSHKTKTESPVALDEAMMEARINALRAEGEAGVAEAEVTIAEAKAKLAYAKAKAAITKAELCRFGKLAKLAPLVFNDW